ncbi:MAG: gliding motility lipoprotein GldH [Bacteroidetes bacterium]|jgi:gliding motility-associated lipoprotein GldH|nr:gliding motility lipoprotein GldH [Bacteroidota bacterium]
MKYLGVIIFSVLLASCTTIDVYEKSMNFENQKWASNVQPSFTFDITDTTSFQNFYLVLRHTEKYPYKNIWLELTIKSPYDTSVIKKEFALADNSKWLGSSIDDIVEHRTIFNPQPIPLKKGSYSFTLKQIMRDDPLPFILSAGIRVQKTNR